MCEPAVRSSLHATAVTLTTLSGDPMPGSGRVSGRLQARGEWKFFVDGALLARGASRQEIATLQAAQAMAFMSQLKSCGHLPLDTATQLLQAKEKRNKNTTIIIVTIKT